MPRVKKAELIEGKVYMASPVRIIHAATPGKQFADNTTIRLDLDHLSSFDKIAATTGVIC